MKLVRGLALIAGLGGCAVDVENVQSSESALTDSTATTACSTNGTKDATGYADTFFAAGMPDNQGPFFQSLGTNGRTCDSCHVREQGWTITPAGVQATFAATNGLDPIFRTNDGSVSPTADVSTVTARKKAYAMLLSKGLIRVGIGIPANAEFTLTAVDDPYHYASAAQLSLFRRPLPSTSLPFLATVMWDGRETAKDANGNFDLTASLTGQATDATLGHAQAVGVDTNQMDQIVDFEVQLFTAQTFDNQAGRLNVDGATASPTELANEPFYVGINDVLGADPTGKPFNPNAFTLFNGWKGSTNARRAAIYRGQQIFNNRRINITGVKGLNDALGVASIPGTCTSCHDTPNVGDHSVSLPIDIGISDASRRTSDMPLYTLTNNTTGAVIQTTDPGRALITGKWADIGKFKGPILRGLGLRAPYFHNGSAASLQAVISFYNARFSIGLTSQEQSDLLAFLQAL